jgi:hypothetical protein
VQCITLQDGHFCITLQDGHSLHHSSGRSLFLQHHLFEATNGHELGTARNVWPPSPNSLTMSGLGFARLQLVGSTRADPLKKRNYKGSIWHSLLIMNEHATTPLGDQSSRITFDF